MTNTQQQIKELEKKAHRELVEIQDPSALEAWRVLYIGRSGKLPEMLRNVKNLPDEEKRIVGKEGNALRRDLEEAYEEKRHAVSKDQEVGLPRVALPAGGAKWGHLHPLTLSMNRIIEIFSAMGFIIADGPEVEEGKYNFDALNIPLDHPARGEGDTFMIDPKSIGGEKDIVLRTQTSPMQIRSVQSMHLTPPFKLIAPGRVFRREKADATHESTFYQFEGLGISETISIADFKGIVAEFFTLFFQKEVTVRLRPSYFPFVEPGFEVDMSCVFCKEGCRICKHTGWIEVMGAGMVHPNVLKNMNIDPEKYQGFAFGGAIDRLTMIRHGVTDIRMFWSGDIRFLRQFS
ncbi:MAG: phenylalanine--tRNA ligase subunit alpha [bacterium]|nr:phenylalanine--tRNA ligase subunit alpha [bacterium]